jgi:hypothetical protein
MVKSTRIVMVEDRALAFGHGVRRYPGGSKLLGNKPRGWSLVPERAGVPRAPAVER